MATQLRIVVPGFLAVVTLVVTAGCADIKGDFERIGVGVPGGGSRPFNNGLYRRSGSNTRTATSTVVFACDIFTNPTGDLGLFQAATDTDGEVVVKGLTFVSGHHRGLFTTGEVRHVFEAEVPEAAFHNTPADWTLPQANLLYYMVASQLVRRPPAGASEGEALKFLFENDRSMTDSEEWLRGVTLTSEFFETGWGDGYSWSSGAFLQVLNLNDLSPVLPLAGPPNNVVDFLLLRQMTLTLTSANAFDEAFEIATDPEARESGVNSYAVLRAYHTAVMLVAIRQLATDQRAFDHVTTPGYTFRHRTASGTEYRVENRGERIVRVEIVRTAAGDPLSPQASGKVMDFPEYVREESPTFLFTASAYRDGDKPFPSFNCNFTVKRPPPASMPVDAGASGGMSDGQRSDESLPSSSASR